MAAGWFERDCTPSSLRLIMKGPREGQHGSRLHKPKCGQELRYISVYTQMKKVKTQSQDRKPLPKGDKE